MDTLLDDYRTGTVQDTETTSAITAALLAYYTAAQVDALLGDYRTASAQDTQTQAAITGALLAYRTGPDRRSNRGELRSHRGAHGRHADHRRGGLHGPAGLRERRSVDGQRGLRRRDELGHGLRAAALRLQRAHRDQHLRLLFLTKNWAGWSKLQVSNNSAAPDSAPELRLLGNQSARVLLERGGGAHQCELIMINDEALVQTKSLSTQLSLTTNQNPGCLGDCRQHGQRGLQHELHGLVRQPGEDGGCQGRRGRAAAAVRLRGGQAVQAPGQDLRLGFASDDFAGTKWKNLTGTAVERRHGDGHARLLAPHQRAVGGVQELPGPAGRTGSLAGAAGAEEQVNMEALRDLADDFNVRDPRKLYRLPRQRDLDVTQAMAFEALKADVGRQVQAPRPRALGKSAAEGPNDRLQADPIDFSQNTLVVMDVFTRATQELTGDDKNFVVTTDGQ